MKMHFAVRVGFYVAAWSLVVLAPAASRAASIERVPLSAPRAVSDDGTTVVGSARFNNQTRPARWTRAGGVEDLGPLPGAGTRPNIAHAVSADGSVVAGQAQDNPYVAWRWTRSDGYQIMPGGGSVYGLSGDGRYVVGGFATGDHAEAYRWTGQGSPQPLGRLPGYDLTLATGVSFAGSAVVGEANDGPADTKGFRWTESRGMQDLGRLPGSSGFVYPRAISNDALSVTGTALGPPEPGNNYNYRAFLWTEGDGMREIGRLPGMLGSWAVDISADGSTVVGHSIAQGGAYAKAWVWTEDTGIRELRHVLASAGADLTGWGELTKAIGVSADGRTIAGVGSQGSFIAVIPEPSCASLLGLCALPLLWRRRA